MHTHTHMYAHVHAHMHTRTHAHTHMPTIAPHHFSRGIMLIAQEIVALGVNIISFDTCTCICLVFKVNNIVHMYPTHNVNVLL